MRRQRNMSKRKEQSKTPEEELKKKKNTNLLHRKCKTLLMRMLHEFWGRINDLSVNFKKEMENIKKELVTNKKVLKLK